MSRKAIGQLDSGELAYHGGNGGRGGSGGAFWRNPVVATKKTMSVDTRTYYED